MKPLLQDGGDWLAFCTGANSDTPGTVNESFEDLDSSSQFAIFPSPISNQKFKIMNGYNWNAKQIIQRNGGRNDNITTNRAIFENHIKINDYCFLVSDYMQNEKTYSVQAIALVMHDQASLNWGDFLPMMSGEYHQMLFGLE